MPKPLVSQESVGYLRRNIACLTGELCALQNISIFGAESCPTNPTSHDWSCLGFKLYAPSAGECHLFRDSYREVLELKRDETQEDRDRLCHLRTLAHADEASCEGYLSLVFAGSK